MNNKIGGFTLIEMMIVVSIIAILAAIALPLYTNYVHRGKQAEAKTLLMAIKLEQEQFRAENNCYATAFTAANFPEGFKIASNARVFKDTGVTLSGTIFSASCTSAAGRAEDFRVRASGTLAKGTDIWAVSNRISAPVHCDGRGTYTADQTNACSGAVATTREY